jgi:hypothetical protein
MIKKSYELTRLVRDLTRLIAALKALLEIIVRLVNMASNYLHRKFQLAPAMAAQI